MKDPVVTAVHVCFFLIGTFFIYVLMATAACFTTWTNDYWWVGDWNELARGCLFVASCVWGYVGFVAVGGSWSDNP